MRSSRDRRRGPETGYRVLGSGERLFGNTSDKHSMRLRDARIVGDGLAYLTYEPVRHGQVPRG